MEELKGATMPEVVQEEEPPTMATVGQVTMAVAATTGTSVGGRRKRAKRAKTQ